MAGEDIERRLAAIMSADVVGYSRLMEADGEATIRAPSTRRRVVDELVTNHRDRVFGSTGDSMIAEFASDVEAVRCAADIQRHQETQDADLTPERRMRLRIGINLGDIVVEDGNFLGDGVTVAARLQAIEESSCLCIAANAARTRRPRHEDFSHRRVSTGYSAGKAQALPQQDLRGLGRHDRATGNR